MKPVHKPWIIVSVDGTKVVNGASGSATLMLTVSEPMENLYDFVNNIFKKGAPFHILEFKILTNNILDNGSNPVKDIWTLLGNFPHQPAEKVLTISDLETYLSAANSTLTNASVVRMYVEDGDTPGGSFNAAIGTVS